ncbi:hypothetical protein FE257_007912 [Aspergillus nanangensis]|uniref:Cytochrome P450 n=1 Tax=Aspergillus nanangensis TaxID=2582783 RepID=A0AAD4CX97_ASPNN|nr:hypothetical protein FE257_007912 [Aspergillus nanangensis]
MFREEARRTFQTNVLGSTAIHTVEPKNIQAMLATQFGDFELGRMRRGVLFQLIGTGISASDGKAWEHSRAMLRPQFVKSHIADLGLQEKHIQELFRQLPTNEDGWTDQINISQMFFRFTLDFTTEFLFGTTVHSQRYLSHQVSIPEADESFPWKDLPENFDGGTKHVQKRFNLLDLYWMHNPKRFRENIKKVHEFIDFCIQDGMERAKHQESCTTSSEKKSNFLNGLITVIQDPVELRNQSLNILIASRDTTTSLVSWTFWLLAKHPNIYNQLRFHILNDFGPPEQTDRITFETLKTSKYLQYVMKEVLRLYPPIAINSRKATRDTTLPLGGGPDEKARIFIKKGQVVIFYPHVTHTLDEFWAPDASRFDPSRWADAKSGWAYLPFSGGPRTCLGQQFALAEAGYIIARMLQRFDEIKLVDPDAGPIHRPGTTDGPADYMIYFHKAPASNQ